MTDDKASKSLMYRGACSNCATQKSLYSGQWSLLPCCRHSQDILDGGVAWRRESQARRAGLPSNLRLSQTTTIYQSKCTTCNIMSSLFSKRIVVAVGVVAVVLPVVSRIFSSPFSLLLLSPLILSVFVLSSFLLYVYLGWYLDSQRTQVPNYLHQAARPFYFSTPAAWEAVMTRSQWSQNTPQSFPPLYPDFPDVSDVLNDIISMIIRDFVNNWYSQLSSSPAFPLAVDSIIRFSLEQTIIRASSIDLPSLIVKRILPKVTAHIDQFRASEVALRGAGLERRLTQSEELDLLLASRYASKGGKLHQAVENLSTTFTRQTEEAHIRQLVDKALPFILPPKEARSKTLRIAIREIVACSVLYPVIEMVTDPDFWNKTIDQVVSTFGK